ncbi:hypothetical protein BT96DRAFT_914916 [Gymnopus androsaceus JB14]|uniref:Uncharacterized protein n=1 Tax=Gymnopus androsaceus JB14 TaxID=1447944 RepID=A0A6A4ID21_9AGAR|nr:hypothetical protein BT96DRAFT_914916 [Gymnopus androsaceus JB14]
MRFTYALLSLALVTFANAQAATNGSTTCAVNTCWENGPDNATDHGCAVWAGGVGAWATCGYVGAILCDSCEACTVGGCYTDPTTAIGTGCTDYEGGVNATAICGFDGAIICHICSP